MPAGSGSVTGDILRQAGERPKFDDAPAKVRFICIRRQALGPLYLADNDVAVDFGRGNELLTEETQASFDEQAALALQG